MAADLALLIALCAPLVDAATVRAIVAQESGGQPYAIGINGRARLSAQPASHAQAAALARALVARGFSVDLGYAQINSRNLARLGLSVDAVLHPCANLQAMQQLLVDAYERAAAAQGPGQTALRAALSTYNTGHPRRGLANGYVAALYRSAAARPPLARPMVAPTTVTSSPLS